MKLAGSNVVDDAGLCRDVYLHIRCVFLNKREQSDIGNDEGVYSGFNSLLDEPLEERYLVVAGEGVAGEVYLYAAGVSLFYGFNELLELIGDALMPNCFLPRYTASAP